MEKISPILKSSARVVSADLTDAGPVRPGAPGFGRPSAEKSVRLPDLMTTAERGNEAMRVQNGWRDKESRRAAAAKEVSDAFFMKPKISPMKEQVSEPTLTGGEVRQLTAQTPGSRPAGFETMDLRSREDFTRSQPMEEDVQSEQPAGLYPKGSFLDRSV